ncbi:MAG TPA: hypothetical protein VLF14_00175 [Candidatus Binatia bacterium]|nr:hypothetical protein [Candidatus Binatia bacterium]
MKSACHRCGAEVGARVVGVRDVCERCRAYLHCCRNCEFYEPGVHNECREPNAEAVANKEQGNFCDYFRLSPTSRGAAGSPGCSSLSVASDARNKLDALFRKK